MANSAILKEERTTLPFANAKTTAPRRLARLLGVIVPAVLLISISLYAHITVARAGEDYTGRLAFFDRLFDLLFVLGLISMTFAVGRAACRKWSLTFISVAEEMAFAIFLGTGIVGMLVFTLGMLKLFKPLPIASLMVLLVALTYREVIHFYKTAYRVIGRNLFSKDRYYLGFLFLMLLVLLILRASAPSYAYDDAISHLATPKVYLQAGGIVPLYDNVTSNMPYLLHMITVVCLMVKSDIAARLFSLSLAFVTGISLYAFSARFLSRKIGVLAMFAFFGAGMVIEVGITNRIDVSLSGMLFLATAAMISYFETGEPRWFYVSALLAGFSMGVKYTAAVWVILLVILFVYESLIRRTEQIFSLVKKLIIFTLISVGLASPWLIKNYYYFANPIYPLLTGEVATYDSQGTRYFNRDDEKKIEAYVGESRKEMPEFAAFADKLLAHQASLKPDRHPLRFWEYYTSPEKYQMGEAEAYHDPNSIFLLTPLLLLLPRRGWLVWLGILSIFFFLFAALSSWMGRYQLPIYPALTILAVYVLVTLAEKFRPYSSLANALPAAVVTIIVASALFNSTAQIYKTSGMRFFTGSLSRREYLQAASYFPAIDYVNHNADKEARVLMMSVEPAYHLQRPYLADPGWDNVEWRRLLIRHNSLQEINEDLKQQGVEYILYNPGMYRFTARMGRKGSGPAGDMYPSFGATANAPDYRIQLQNWLTFELYRGAFLEPVYEQNEVLVLKVK